MKKRHVFLVLFLNAAPPDTMAQEKCLSKSEVQFPVSSGIVGNTFRYKIIPAVNNAFCCDLFAAGKLLIHQPGKPGLPGNEGFKTKADAEKVVHLVISKIIKGEFPPSVTTEELKKLNVL